MSSGDRSSWRVPPAKITPPRVPSTFLVRAAPRAAVAAATDLPVTLVCAPPGYGKTLLLADCLGTTGAWVSVDAGDDDPGRFWSAVLAALCSVVPADSPVRDLVVPAEPDADFVAELVDALDLLSDPVVLVLDDVHELRAPRSLHGIATLIRHRPAGLRLVLVSRFDPPLPLARLRPAGRLAELRADTLAFSPEDADRLLRAAGIVLRPDQVATLVELTEGWPAGLRLAVSPLREAADRDAFLADVARGGRPLAEHLVREVLARLPAATREFLRLVSVCDELTPGLAEALSGRADAGVLLDELAWASSLVLRVAAEPGWYRVHPMLRAHLVAELAGDLAGTVHGRAAEWFAVAGRPVAALEHALRTGRVAVVRNMLRREGIGLLLRGEHRVVRRGLAVAGTESDPLISAFTHVQEGDPAAAEAVLADTPRSGIVTELVAATCSLAAGRSPPPAALPDADPGLRGWAHSVRGRALLAEGDAPAAGRELRAGCRIAREHGFEYLVLRCVDGLAAVHALTGDYPAMTAAGAESVALATGSGRPEHTALATGHAVLGFASLVRCHPLAAAGHAAEASRFAETVPHPALRFAVDLVAGAARFDTGGATAGARAVREARHRLGDAAVPAQLVAVAALIEHQACGAVGWAGSAKDVLTWARARIGRTAELALMTAWSDLSRGDTVAARDSVRSVVDGVLPVLVPLTRLEARLLETALALAADERTHARTALATALALAEPAELIRPFEHAPPAVRQLLVDQIGGFGPAEGFAGRVQRALSVRHDHGGRLTAQERVVLHRLTSQRSLDEVAADLDVSVNTVKTHVRAIYAKLGVNNRRTAVIAARERGLTP